MLEDGVEHRPRELGQIGHELTEFAVEVAEKQQGLFAQNREARVVNRADGIFAWNSSGISGGSCSASAFASAGDFKGKLR